jgi:hypothetical protein
VSALCSCTNQSVFTTSSTVEADKEQPIPPIPVTGSFLTGDVVRPEGSVAANGILDIVDEVQGAILHSVNLSDEGDFSLPLNKVLSAELALRIKDQDKYIFTIVRLPADIVQTINKIKIAAGEPVLNDSIRPTETIAEDSTLTLKRRMSLKLPANGISSSGSAELIWQTDKKQKVFAASLPLKDKSASESAII